VTDKLKLLLERCKCGVFLTVNAHRDYYQAAGDYIIDQEEDFPAERPEVFARMVELDTVIRLQFYPHTPVGCYVIWDHDLDSALDAALGALGLTIPSPGSAAGA